MRDLMRNFRGIALVAALGISFGGVAAWAAATVGIPVPYVTSLSTADVVAIVKGAVPSAQNTYASLLQIRNFVLAGNSQVGIAPPVLTSCGTGSPTISGTNSAGLITVGTSATGCVATFATAYVSAPVCTVVSETAPATTTPAYSVSTTAITIVQTSTSGNKYDYVCVAQPGG